MTTQNEAFEKWYSDTRARGLSYEAYCAGWHERAKHEAELLEAYRDYRKCVETMDKGTIALTEMDELEEAFQEARGKVEELEKGNHEV